MSITFVYRKIGDGKEIKLPALKSHIERRFPNHIKEIASTMKNMGLDGWRIVFTPMKSTKGGVMIKGLKTIFLSANATEFDMRETLYHEIFHVLVPYYPEEEWRTYEDYEAEIEEMGITFTRFMEKLWRKGYG